MKLVTLIVAFQGAKMRQKSVSRKEPAERVIKGIRRATRRDKIRIVLEGLPGEDSIAELCRREGIVQNVRVWRKWLARRDRQGVFQWSRLNALLKRHPLPPARIVHRYAPIASKALP
jgi:transposase-like protein